jgi:hypothetical protein
VDMLHQRPASGPRPTRYPAAYRRRVLARSDERDLYEARRDAAERAAYERGLEDGRRQGYEYAHREMDHHWNVIATPIARSGPSFAALERKRWGTRGRERFGDPRPGDYPGAQQ